MPKPEKKMKNKDRNEYRLPKGYDKAVDSTIKSLKLHPVDFHRTTYVKGALTSGSLSQDLCLGGGLPKGRIMTVNGPEGSGKSTMAYHYALEAIRLGIPVWLFDHEYSADAMYLSGIGFDIKSARFKKLFNYLSPDSGEDSFRIMARICRGIEPVDDSLPSVLFLADSLAAMLTEAEEEDDSKTGMAEQARMFSRMFRQVKGPIGRAGASLLCINQVRTKPGVMYGNPEYSPGGNAPRFYADIVARVGAISVKTAGKSGRVEREETTDGKIASYQHSTLRTSKNKVFPPFRESEFRIEFGKGIDPVFDAYEFLQLTGQIVNGNKGLKLSIKDATKELKLLNGQSLSRKEFARIVATRTTPVQKFLRAQILDNTAFELYNQAEESRPVRGK